MVISSLASPAGRMRGIFPPLHAPNMPRSTLTSRHLQASEGSQLHSHPQSPRGRLAGPVALLQKLLCDNRSQEGAVLSDTAALSTSSSKGGGEGWEGPCRKPSKHCRLWLWEHRDIFCLTVNTSRFRQVTSGPREINLPPTKLSYRPSTIFRPQTWLMVT